MKYCSVNRLNDFEFHDAVIESPVISNKNLIFRNVNYLNIHKTAPQNPSEFDMRIDGATITFSNFTLENVIPYNTAEQGDLGKKVLTGAKADEYFYKIVKASIDVFSVSEFQETENGRFSCLWECMGVDPFLRFFSHLML